MSTSLGKVGIVDKGNYSAEVVYNSGDFVLYEGSTWLALKDGLTGIKPTEGENWKYLARGVSDGIATVEQVGVVKPSTDLTITEDGSLGISTVFEAIEERANIESGDTWKTVLGKINKYFGDIKPHVFLDKITEQYIDSVITEKVNNAIQNSMIANNLVTDNENMVLAAPMGKKLQEQISDVNKNLGYKYLGLITQEIITNPKYNESYIGYISGATAKNLGLTNNAYKVRYTQYAKPAESYGSLEVCAVTGDEKGVWLTNYANGGTWIGWQKSITNSDFDDVNFGKAYIQLGSDTGTSCRIYYNGEIRSVNYLEGENYENNYRSFNLLK